VAKFRAIHLRGLFIHKTLLLVGVGQTGFGDPNFGSLMNWLRTGGGWRLITNLFILCRAGDVSDWRSFFQNDARVRLLPFGDTHDALPDWLRQFADELSRMRSSMPAAPRLMPPSIDERLHLFSLQFWSMGPDASFRAAWQYVCSNEPLLGPVGVWTRLS
jgi:hypothetical protein